MKKDLNIPRDKDIRRAFIKANFRMFEQENCYFVNEYGLNKKNIVDLAFFDFNNNNFYGFEIKSGVDNLARLEKQLCSYTNMFNIVYVICSDKHVEHVLSFLSDKKYGMNIGVIRVNNNLEFLEIKKAIRNEVFFHDFIRNLDVEELTLLCESKNISTAFRAKSSLLERLKTQVSFIEVLGALKNKIIKYYSKECKVCSSRIYYNKCIAGDKVSFCYKCNSIIQA